MQLSLTQYASRCWFGVFALLPLLTFGQEDDIRGLKDQVEIPQIEPTSFLWIWITLGLVLLLVGLALAFYFFIWKRKDPVASLAHCAMNDLDRARQFYIEKESAEPFANEVANVIRNYIESRFQISAPRQTTEEFLGRASEDQRINPFSVDLKSFLERCDEAKYAGGELDLPNRDKLFAAARHFIQESSIVNLDH